MLASPTEVGHTHALTRWDGAVVAVVLWERLPYWIRTLWRERAGRVDDAALGRYLEGASPLALEAALSSATLSGSVRAKAAARWEAMPPAERETAELGRHFDRLLRGSRAKLLRHLAAAESRRPDLDRLDLLSEIVALTEAGADVQVERSVTRAFRAFFTQREAVAVWVLIALTFAVHLFLTAAGPDSAERARRSLWLEPGLARPWGLVTYTFVHLADPRHVLLNMVALAGVGPVLEQVLGARRFVLFYLGGAVVGGLVSAVLGMAMDVPFATVGASAAVAATGGLAVSLGLWFSRRYGRLPLAYVAGTLGGGAVLVGNLLLGLAADSSLDHIAHLGGLAFGLVIAWVLAPGLAARADARYGKRMAPT
jgi:membrane associated rhomboid family serine protease